MRKKIDNRLKRHFNEPRNFVRHMNAVVLATVLAVSMAACSNPLDASNNSGSAKSVSVDISKSSVPAPNIISPAQDSSSSANSANSENSANQDTQSNTTGNSKPQTTASTSFPGNPSVPLPSSIASFLPDDAMFVSAQYVQTSNGTFYDASTGAVITDPNIIGSFNQPPDPLAKSQGQSFVPQTVGDVRKAMEQAKSTHTSDFYIPGAQLDNDSANTNDSNTSNDSPTNPSTVVNSQPYFVGDNSGSNTNSGTGSNSFNGLNRTSNSNPYFTTKAYFPNSPYGPYWGSYNNSQAFFDGSNNLFVQQAKGVIDVSEWQGMIDWQAVKNSGVQGAIIRIGWGDNGVDHYAARNIYECKRLGIPFGIYLYSYAGDANNAAAEGAATVNRLRTWGVNPSDMEYPVFYDLENWSWSGHYAPSNPGIYDSIVNNWFMQVQLAGYGNVSVYSYTSYLYSALNTTNIHSRTRWVAQYGAYMGFGNFTTNDRGWQYASNGSIYGINGNVDINAFGNRNYIPTVQATWQNRSDEIAVGASVNVPYGIQVQYQWLSYNTKTGAWETISGWSNSNWSDWRTSVGDYWLQVQVRNAMTGAMIDTETMPFHYVAGYTNITSTYAGWDNGSILLGMSSDNSYARYQMKIYDVNRQAWIAGFAGQWARWYPAKGTYWTHYEVYTADGRLGDVKTYAFQVN